MDPRDVERVALLSIRPEFARAIFAGQKLVEFRRSALAADVEIVLVYATQPVGNVLGWFTISDICESTPDGLWRRFSKVGGIGRRAYFDYFDGAQRAYGIQIKRATALADPIALDDVVPGLRAPQSVQYLPAGSVRAVLSGGLKRRISVTHFRPAFAT